jgi:DNA-binding NarL/FixJ family response regulator
VTCKGTELVGDESAKSVPLVVRVSGELGGPAFLSEVGASHAKRARKILTAVDDEEIRERVLTREVSSFVLKFVSARQLAPAMSSTRGAIKTGAAVGHAQKHCVAHSLDPARTAGRKTTDTGCLR